MTHTYIPSPPADWGQVSLGPFTVHAYAIFILIGMFVAVWLTTKRWIERGGNREVVGDVAIWAIPFGIIGARLYHVISSPDAYFGEGGDLLRAFRIWEGGLGIWGGVALGAVGAYIGCRRAGVSFTAFVDSAAPAVLFAQAIGRLGNWFNQELFGRPTDLPWGLQIDPGFRPPGYEAFETFHPTFLYEILWNVAGAFLIIYVDRRYRLYGGRVLWLYVMVYTSGRLWIETMRIDDAEIVGGLRINVWVSLAILSLSVFMFFWLGARQRKQGPPPERNTLAAPRAAVAVATEVEPAPAVASADATPASATSKPAAKKPAAKAPTASAKPAAKATAPKASAATSKASASAKSPSAAKPAAKKPAAAKKAPAPKSTPKPKPKADPKA